MRKENLASTDLQYFTRNPEVKAKVKYDCSVPILEAAISAKSLWPPSDESPPPLPLFQCCYNDVDFSFDIFLNLQNNIGQGVCGKRKPLSNVIV